MRSTKPAPAKTSARPRFATAARAAAIFVMLIFVAAAMLMAARDPSSASIPAPAPATTAATPIDDALTASSDGSGRAVAAPITIVGCLEQKGDAFRLKNTEGDEAPKARSWKSGFLRKGSATVSIVGASSRLKLSNHVGERVRVTGTLEEREIKARSVKTIASCR
jgi:hypothetical protein